MTGGVDKDAEVLPLLTPKQRALVERALPKVEARARWYARRYAGLVDREQLVAAGGVAVVEAVRRYDEAQDVPFEAYVSARIDGSMLDLIRAETSARRRDVAMRRAMAALSGHHRGGFDVLRDGPEEIQARLQAFSDELATVAFVAGVEVARRSSPDDDAAERAEYSAAMRALGEGLAELPEDERRALEAVFVDGMDMREAEAFLGVAYITVRRRLERGRERLRKALVRRGVRSAPPPRDEPGVEPVLRGARGEPPVGRGGGERGRGPRGR
ncbi:sigma-70 family RNA polymerase sigma factor [Sorangium sp. So ce291]|uniref:sigma-70 family RNA polymerase sigma factor n=1 Tax=Sorangium sp. So ce291 TaxID=3133294 RepID=UPI003F61522A